MVSVKRSIVGIKLFLLAWLFSGCAPAPAVTYDYRWQILEAEAWQPEFRASTTETGIILHYKFDNIRRAPNEFNMRVTMWRYPLDTVLVVTQRKESMPENGTYEVTRMYYDIKGNPLRFEVVVIPREENVIVLTPGTYFLYVSPGVYRDMRIKEVEVKANHLSILNLHFTETRIDKN